MKLHICAVGRMRAIDTERAIFDDYLTRFNRTARPLGLGPLTEHEVEDRKGGGMAAEADLLVRAVPIGALLVAMDERGLRLVWQMEGGAIAHIAQEIVHACSRSCRESSRRRNT